NNFSYSSNMMDDINPYEISLNNKGTGLVELPVHWVLDDAPFFMFSPKSPSRPIHSANSVFNIWKEEFNSYYEEKALFKLVMHPQFIGRPYRIAMLKKLIEYISSFKNVTFATGEDVVKKFLKLN